MKFLIGGLLLLGAWLLWRRWRRSAQARYIANFPLHSLLDTRLAARRPELDAAQRTAVLDALRDYFIFCHQAGRRMLAMPSQAVDDAWHEFILFTRQYDSFCRHAFGRFLHHTPAEAMSSPTQASNGIKRAWRLACRHEGINPRQPERLPRLFALDATLGIAGGFVSPARLHGRPPWRRWHRLLRQPHRLWRRRWRQRRQFRGFRRRRWRGLRRRLAQGCAGEYATTRLRPLFLAP